jgi:hypothetical protein
LALSGRTIAELIEHVAEAYTHTQLDTLFVRVGADQYLTGGAANKEAKVQQVVSGAQSSLGEPEADQLLLSIAQDFLSRYDCPSNELPDSPRAMTDALGADGWEWTGHALVPTTPSPVNLAPEVTGLDAELTAAGLAIAVSHYRQAVENFTAGRYESANGQLRSFLENLAIELCQRATGRALDDPGAALQHLRQTGQIDGGEFNIGRGLLEVSNTRGAHHGLSTNRESLFRVHTSTAFARHLLARLETQRDA